MRYKTVMFLNFQPFSFSASQFSKISPPSAPPSDFSLSAFQCFSFKSRMSPTSGNLIRDFRGDLRASLPLQPLEKALIIVAALHVCSLPWMLGGMRVWAQFIGLGLALVAIIVALVPRNYDGDLVHRDSYELYPHRTLIRWPLFWIGLMFFVYLLIQAFNPAWEFVQMENSWGMRQIEHIAWLPHGMRTPFETMNPWRQLIIWGAPFLLCCSLWAGLTRRKFLRLLVTVVVGNCVLFAVFALIQRATDAKEIYWSIKSSNEFFGAFIYRNHGGAYLVLGFMLTAALATWHRHISRHRMARSSPALVLAFFSCVVLIAVGVSYSRGSVLALTGCLLWLLVLALIGFIRRSSQPGHFAIIVILVLMFTGFCALGLKALNA
jgi:hypothetical protein